MTRALLAILLSLLTLALGLWTCLVQSSNHERASELAHAQREWEMLDAANAQAEATVSAHVWGMPNERTSESRAQDAGASE